MRALVILSLALVACGGTGANIEAEGSRDPIAAMSNDAGASPESASGEVDAAPDTPDGGSAEASSSNDAATDADDPAYATCAASACGRVGACGVQPTTCNGRPVDCGGCNWESFPFGRDPNRDGYCNDRDLYPATCGHQCSQLYDHSDPTCGIVGSDHSFGACGAPSNPSSLTKIYTWDASTKTKTYRAGGTLGCTWKTDRWCCP